MTKAYHVEITLMSNLFYTNINLRTILHYDGTDAAKYEKYSTLAAMNSSKGADYITPEELSNKLHIRLKIADRTLKATTFQFILSTRSLTRHFRTDKAHLRYTQLAKVFGSFYADYLKSKTRSIWGYVGDVVYTNKLGFYKLAPCENETRENTVSSLRSFIDIVGLPYILHLDNHGNFKDGLFKKLLRKFVIFQTFAESYSPRQNHYELAIGYINRHAQNIIQALNH